MVQQEVQVSETVGGTRTGEGTLTGRAQSQQSQSDFPWAEPRIPGAELRRPKATHTAFASTSQRAWM